MLPWRKQYIRNKSFLMKIFLKRSANQQQNMSMQKKNENNKTEMSIWATKVSIFCMRHLVAWCCLQHDSNCICTFLLLYMYATLYTYIQLVLAYAYCVLAKTSEILLPFHIWEIRRNYCYHSSKQLCNYTYGNQHITVMLGRDDCICHNLNNFMS